MTSALTMISTGRACTRATVAAWARNLSRRCTSVTDFAQRLQRQRPVERRVAAADDDHVVAGQVGRVR